MSISHASARPVILFLLLATGAFAQATEEWSRFRGPNGLGVAVTKALPVAFGPKTNLAWRTALPPGHSSPVLWKNRIFLTAVEDKRLFTYCLSRDTGKILWRSEAQRSRVTKQDGRNNAASPTAAVDEDTVVVFFSDLGMLAYDHEGKLQWKLPLGPFKNEYGMGASPVLRGDGAFLACDHNTGSFLIAVSKKDGKVLWKTDRPFARSGHSTPIFYEPKDGPPQIIVPGSFYLDAYDTVSGKRIWWIEGLSFEMKSTPVLHEGIIYINGYGSPLNQPGVQIKLPTFAKILETNDSDADKLISRPEMPRSRAAGFFEFVDLDGNGSLGKKEWGFLTAALASRNGLLAIRAGGRGDMTAKNVLWTYHRSIPQLPSPLLYGGVLYMLNDQGGLISTLKPATGERIERGRLKGASDNYYASPVAADDKVYLVGQRGLVTVLKIGGSLEPLAVNDLGEECYATPAIAAGSIFLRTVEALYCFRRNSRK